MEHHLRKIALLKYLRDNDDYLPEFKQFIAEAGILQMYLRMYGLNPMGVIADLDPVEFKG